MSIGPKVQIKKSCYGCDCEKSERYAVQGDSGHRVYCSHPSVGKKFIADTNWETPNWCPAEPRHIDVDIDDGA